MTARKLDYGIVVAIFWLVRLPPAMSASQPHRPELMSPAGDWDALRAAVANGADAVYFGLENHNARFRATNFKQDELGRVMDYLHAHNVKGYLTFNTLIFSDELAGAVDYINAIIQARVDAVIVQDLGLARLIRSLAPQLELHGSTQMTLTEPRGIEFVRRNLGVRRIVLARELSVKDVDAIVHATDVPVEVFIHGALCVAYSGQCLTSESLGGRSANRGQCAQACRLPYDLIVDGRAHDIGDKAYLLSPQDLAAYDLVDDLVQRGVSCFKIEGRLKSAQYVAATTRTYRAALDAALEHRRFEITAGQKRDLAQIFSRGFTHAFLDGVDHSELVPALFPKSRGIRIGTVAGVTRRGVLVQVERVSSNGRMKIDLAPGEIPLKPGDGVVFDQGHPEEDEQGGRIYEVFPSSRPANGGRRGPGPANRKVAVDVVEITFARGAVALEALETGAIVWKTDDPEVRRGLEQSYARDVIVHRVPVDLHVYAALGQPLTIRLVDSEGRTGEATWQQPLERAMKHPLTLESLREQFSRLGETPFALRHIQADALDPVMVPRSVLNELRRQAVDQLIASVKSGSLVPIANPRALEQLRQEAAAIAPESAPAPVRMTVLVRTLDQLHAVLGCTTEVPIAMVYCDFEDVRKYQQAVPAARDRGMPIGLATTRIIKPGEEGLLRLVAQAGPDAVLVRNLAGLSFYREQFPDVPLVGDYSLNVANELTAALLLQSGLRRLVPGYDLNWRQLVAMMSRIAPAHFEAVIHQHMPMFHMEHCVFCHALSNGHDHRDCGRPCDHHRVNLRDRVGQEHPLIADVGCRNTVYNGVAQSAAELVPSMKELGLSLFRVELLREDALQASNLIARYADVIRGQIGGPQAVRSLRVLSQLGVTRGTFDYE